MRLNHALNRGIRFGAQLGLIAALGLALASGGSSVFITSQMLGLDLMLGAAANVLAQSLAGIFTGAAIGGATFATTHAVVHSIPGLPRLLGDAPPRHQHRKAGVSSRSREFRQEVARMEEADDRNVGFRRMIEEQRIQQEMIDQQQGRN